MVRGLANDDGAAIVAARGDTPYSSAEELQRRAGVRRGALDRIADADSFASLGNSRREGVWAVRGLWAAALPPFAAADHRPGRPQPTAPEPHEVGRATCRERGC